MASKPPANARKQDPVTRRKAEDLLNEFRVIQAQRSNFETLWEQIACQLWPTMRGTFKPGMQFTTPGDERTVFQMDATPEIALGQFSAILDSLLTPRTQKWHALSTTNEDLNKVRNVALYFEKATNVLFAEREAATANFASQNMMRYKSQGAFGTGTTFVDSLIGGKGLRYRACHVGEIFIKENHQGTIDTTERCFPMTVRQVAQRFGIEQLPFSLASKLHNNSGEDTVWVLHCVKPREDYDETRLDAKGRPWADYYVLLEEGWLLQEGGYDTKPYITARYDQAPGETYGRAPAMVALPAIRMLNEMKATHIKVGHLNSDPILLLPDDGILDTVNRMPGSTLMGGMDADGKPRVGVLPAGRHDVVIDMMDKEREIINSVFLVSLMSILSEVPDRETAYAAQLRKAEQSILLAPTVGGQFSSLSEMIDRELDILSRQGKLPPMPRELLEAKGEYRVKYTSPMARMMKSTEVVALMQSFQMATQVATATGDPSVMDSYNMEVALPASADIEGVPISWMREAAQIQRIKDGRAQAAAAEQQAAAAPGTAALIAAGAKAKQAGLEL